VIGHLTCHSVKSNIELMHRSFLKERLGDAKNRTYLSNSPQIVTSVKHGRQLVCNSSLLVMFRRLYYRRVDASVQKDVQQQL